MCITYCKEYQLLRKKKLATNRKQKTENKQTAVFIELLPQLKKHSFYGIFIEGLPLDMFWQLPNSKEQSLKMHLLVKNYCTKYEVLTFTYFWILERSRCFLESVFLNLLAPHWPHVSQEVQKDRFQKTSSSSLLNFFAISSIQLQIFLRHSCPLIIHVRTRNLYEGAIEFLAYLLHQS